MERERKKRRERGSERKWQGRERNSSKNVRPYAVV